MADIGGGEPHVTELLGLYYLDTLGPADGAVVESHLPTCAECRESAEQAVETIALLALLSERDRDEVLDNFGALNRTGPPSERFVRFFAPDPEPSASDEQPAPLAPTSDFPDEHAPELDEPGRAPRRRLFGKRKAAAAAEPEPPQASEPAPAAVAAKVEPSPPPPPPAAEPIIELSGDSARSRRDELVGPPRRKPRRSALIRASALLVLVVVLGGLAVGALVHGPGASGPAAVPVVTAAATAADSSTGASLSVFVTQREGGVNVRATVNGLRAGAGYRLQAVTYDGHAWPVVNWTSDGKLQDITADVQVPISALVFFTVSRAGSGPAVSAYLAPS